MKKILFFCLMVCFGLGSEAQVIFEPEGVNMPGAWNGWANVPTNLAFANSNQASGGRITKISTGTTRWQTIFNAASSGGDVTGGSYEFKFSSGPTSNYYNNFWGGTAVTLNTLQTHNIGSGPNSSVTLTNDRWYTVNFIDNGYNSTQAIFMETVAAPVNLVSAAQSPLSGSVESTDNVTVTVTASAAPSAGENVYVRWTTNGFTTSSLAAVTFVGSVGTATIPSQAEGVQVDYYVFSTTLTNPAVNDADKVTIKFLNAGSGNFTYTVNTALPQVDITFQVDMSQQTVAGAVNIAGSFTGWSEVAMTDMGGGVYAYTFALNQGASVQYKFKNGSSYEGSIGGPCGNGSDRTYVVGTEDYEIPTVCFGSCFSCPPTSSVTFQVNMSNETVGGSVYINGNFPPANWSTPQLMTDAGGGIYTYNVTLPQGNSYEYKFINGSTYEGNLGIPCGNGFNRTYTVPATSSATISPACFGACSNCANNSVTFRVNMSNETVGGSVYINGSFPPANWTTPQLMTNIGGGVYVYTTTLPQGASYEYKFINDVTYEGNLSAPCGNGFNRTLTVPATTSSTLTTACFSSCIDCVTMIDVTFALNLSDVAVSANGVHLAGGFGSAGYPDWSANGIPMSDSNGDGVYTVMLSLPEGQTFEYKFINGNSWAPGNDESVPGACNSNGNRFFTVPSFDSTLPVVCFQECADCVASVGNDTPYDAVNVSFSSNVVYPNCYAISGNTSLADNSVQSGTFAGNDVWYRFTAQSNAVSITLTSATQDDVIELYSKTGSSFVLMPGGTENASSGAGDFERLNYTGLTPNETYYVSVGAFDASTNGAFTLCIQHLMPSGCALAVPVGGFNLCNSYKAVYRGAAGNGVSYDFTFTGVGGGASGTTSVSATNGLISLANPTLNLRYGGIYDVEVDVNYSLLNSASGVEPIVVAGSSSSANCSNVTIRTQPQVEVKSTQRCSATLLRSNWLIGAMVTGQPLACGVVNYTYEFTQVVSCADGTTAGAAVEYTTSGATAYLPLGVLPNLGSNGAWDVRIRPNFIYGNGVYGPVQRISVANTAASEMLSENGMIDEAAKEYAIVSLGLYPNPNNGELLNINLTDVEQGDLFVRVMDSFGRVVYQNRYTVNETLNTVITFDETLANGVYLIEFSNAGEVNSEKFIVQH